MPSVNLKLVSSNGMESVSQAAQLAGTGAAGAVKASSMVLGGAGILSAIIVMVFLEPQSKKEKFLCFLSTFIFAVCLSSAIKLYFGFDLPQTMDGHIAYAGLVIASGIPGWVIVRASFLTMEKMKGKDIGQIIKIVRGWFGK